MSLYYYFLYRPLMRLAHRYNWHYAPPIYPEGDTQLWCKWCGFRETTKRRVCTIAELEEILNGPETDITILTNGEVRAGQEIHP